MAADTFSPTLGYLVMGTGNDNNSWGSNANAEVFAVFEDAIANALTNTVTGGTLDLSGSPPPSAASQVRHAALIFNGTLLSNQIIQVPNLTKFWFVQNATAGAFTLKLQTPAAVLSTAIPQNSGWQLVQCDGANNIIVSPFNSKQIQMPDGLVSAPAFSNVNEPNSGWRRAGTQDWRLTINGADVLQVTGAGAGTPNVFNVLSPLALQSGGVQIVPPGTILKGAFITLPSGFVWPNGQTLNRVTFAPLFNALTATVTGNTNGNTAITGLSADMRGQGLNTAFVEGIGISLGTTITFTGATTATLSVAASGSTVGLTLRILPHGQGDGSITFTVPDERGKADFTRDDIGGTAAGNLGTVATDSGTVVGTQLRNSGHGSPTHVQTNAEMVLHNHGGNTGGQSADHSHTYTGGSNQQAAPGGQNMFNATPAAGQSTGGTSNDHGHGINNDGSSQAMSLLNPLAIRNSILKT